MNNRSLTAYFYLLTTFFLWGSVYVFSDMVIATVPVPVVAGLRYLLGLLPLLVVLRRLPRQKLRRQDYKYVAGVGVLGYYGTVTLNMIGISLSGANISALINSLSPVAITVVAAVMLKERINRTKVVCLLLAISGAAVVSSGAGSSQELLGIWFVLGSVVCWGFCATFVRYLTQHYHPVRVTAYGIAVSLALHLPTAMVSVVRAGGLSLTPVAILALLYLGLIGTALAQFCWSKSLSLLPASTCSLFYPLQAFFSVVLGWLLFDDRVSLTFLIGAVLIVADVALNCLDNNRQQRLSADQTQPPVAG